MKATKAIRAHPAAFIFAASLMLAAVVAVVQRLT